MDPVIPPISTAQMPAEVRASGAKGQALYQAALSFESQLVNQMAQALASTAQSDQSNSDDPSSDAVSSTSSDAATSMYTQMLPDALTQGITNAGGLGLADNLWRVMWQAQGGTLGGQPTTGSGA
jgi:Rod binding domain-containing protein